MTDASDLIGRLELTPHPEGGWYKETWRGPDGAGARAIGTMILFLLETHQRSHWHRVDAHELWLWQAGDPLDLMIAPDENGPTRTLRLGPQLGEGHQFQGVVPALEWQAAEPVPGDKGYTLATCIVTPGFEFAGFELAEEGWGPAP